MKQTVSLYTFRQAFADAGRANQFSYEGLEVLFDYLEQLEQDTGTEMELDVVAICCDFAEDTPEAIAEHYNIDLSACEDDEEKMETVKDWLNDNTSVCGATDNTIVYCQSF